MSEIQNTYILAYAESSENKGKYVAVDESSGGYPYATEDLFRATKFKSLHKALLYAKHFKIEIDQTPLVLTVSVEAADLTLDKGFHDVLMVAFDISGPSAEKTHAWLQEQMPDLSDEFIEAANKRGIQLDSWWVANDERFDFSDQDSAVFVAKGLQSQARELLRIHGMRD